VIPSIATLPYNHQSDITSGWIFNLHNTSVTLLVCPIYWLLDIAYRIEYIVAHTIGLLVLLVATLPGSYCSTTVTISGSDITRGWILPFILLVIHWSYKYDTGMHCPAISPGDRYFSSRIAVHH